MAEYKPKSYFDNGRTVEWEKDLTPDVIASLNAGEIFTLLDLEGKPHSRLLKDSYGQLLEGSITPPNNLAAMFFGVPASPFAPDGRI